MKERPLLSLLKRVFDESVSHYGVSATASSLRKMRKAAHELESKGFFWERTLGGMVCGDHPHSHAPADVLILPLFFHDLTVASFKEIREKDNSSAEIQISFGAF